MSLALVAIESAALCMWGLSRMLMILDILDHITSQNMVQAGIGLLHGCSAHIAKLNVNDKDIIMLFCNHDTESLSVTM